MTQATYFFSPARSFTVEEIVAYFKIELRPAKNNKNKISAVSSVQQAQENSAIYIQDKKYLPYLKQTKAAAVFCSAKLADLITEDITLLISNKPYEDFVKFAGLLYPDALRGTDILGEEETNNGGYIHETASIGKNVIIEKGAYIGKNVSIGEGTIIAPGVIIGKECKIGKHCYIGPNATLEAAIVGDHVKLLAGCRIGQDGFGYISTSEGLVKVPQLGWVIIHDWVEIGANSTVDRGSFGNTIIGKGTKIDNLVQIAHNVTIGRFCIIAGHCGISGSVTIKDGAVLGGRVGLKDHIIIGKSARIAASSGVMDNIPDGEVWGGIPAQPLKQWFREIVALRARTKQNN